MTAVRITDEELARHYVSAKRAVVDHGYIDEITWQASVRVRDVSPTSFLREAAWVVLNTGMRESVIRLKFADLDHIFHGFDPELTWQRRRTVRAKALGVFRHEAKVDAIIEIAGRVRLLSSEDLRRQLRDPEPFLTDLPYVGPVTWKHLAKNLGMSISKPDRHLARFTERVGWTSVDEVCSEISGWIGDPIDVVDVVLWRWSVLNDSQCGPDCHPSLMPVTAKDQAGMSPRPSVPHVPAHLPR